MKRRYLAVPLTALAGLVLGIAPAAQAAPKPTIACGSVISKSVTLTTNLNCSGTALSIDTGGPSGPRITVDLGGHRVSSTIPAGTTSSVPTIGVSSPTILQNGTVRSNGFVTVQNYANSTYRNLVFDGGWFSSYNWIPTIRHNQFINGASIRTVQDTIDIEDNVFVKGPSTITAIFLDQTDATVIGNAVTGYGRGIVIDNIVSVADFRNNDISNSGVGIVVGGNGTDAVTGTINGNRVTGNVGDGIFLGVGSGISSMPANPAGLTATGNVASNNGGDGIHISPVATNPNGGILGINVTISGNQAVGNSRYGIESTVNVPNSTPSQSVSVTDGGGNTAKKNAAGQCLNLTCTK